MVFTTLVFCTLCIFGIFACRQGHLPFDCSSMVFWLNTANLALHRLIDLLLDDRILIFHCVLDDLGMFHHHCVDVVLVMLVMHAGHACPRRFAAGSCLETHKLRLVFACSRLAARFSKL